MIENDKIDTFFAQGFSDLTKVQGGSSQPVDKGDGAALTVENLIRPVKLTKKNALFAGSDDGARTWARCASLIGTCKLNGVNPQVYLTDTLRRIIDMHPLSRIDELMPWNFDPTIPGVTRQQG